MFSKKFIQRTTEYTMLEKSVPAPYFRKRFFLANLPPSAQITVCGLGFYELYLNGENITKGRFSGRGYFGIGDERCGIFRTSSRIRKAVFFRLCGFLALRAAKTPECLYRLRLRHDGKECADRCGNHAGDRKLKRRKNFVSIYV